MSGFTRATKALVWARAEGRCERCGRDVSGIPHSTHHRRARAMGGSTAASTGTTANALLLCGSGVTMCHGEVESGRRLALDQGFLVSQYADPAQVEVLWRGKDWVFLGTAGELLTMPPPIEACS